MLSQKGCYLSVIDLSNLPFPGNNLRSFLDSVCETHELDFAAYAGMDPIAQTVHGFVNYPDEWQTRYVKEGFQYRDPALLLASRSIAPVDWQRLRGERTFRDIFRAARDHGISEQGLTVPVRGPYGDVGLFSVTRNCSDREWDLLKAKILGELQTAAVHLHDNVIHSHALTRKLHHPSLSAREVEILQWIAAGKSQQDVADILSISNRTVEVHLRSGRSKLGALTTPQAVGRAIGLGLIHPE
ncbi:DNA-binding transcriptional regulator, CsgD family [Pseudosulfitobacter pseudonitzschiae]|uniref:LuxR family transcriptional regulator n=1 Tax=Pseudosulfitobacter pseudonitzschiae TaxID=1402135 RepID=A0A8F9S4H5_9RHOB|nr:LuxR family transcriptional regulator [Pseudosulfitobacter pseudonitzschiae]SHE87103.1 DNA-binding transcriptional regulator, CsgD family [Pseudosulfitobacter pseudonitzschiae]